MPTALPHPSTWARIRVHRDTPVDLTLTNFTGLRALHILGFEEDMAALREAVSSKLVEGGHDPLAVGERISVASLAPDEMLVAVARRLGGATEELTPSDYADAASGAADLHTMSQVMVRAASMHVTGTGRCWLESP